MKELAIFISAYKERKLLKRCVDSILKQPDSYKIDIVIIFDCGDKETEEIGRTLASENQNVQFYANDINRGVAYGRIVSSRYFTDYKYITYVDADDILSSNALEIYFNLINEYPTIDIFFNDLEKMKEVIPFSSVYDKDKFEIVSASSLLYTYYNALHLHIFKVEAIKDFKFDEMATYDDLDFKVNFVNSSLKVLMTNCKVIGYYINNEGKTLGPKPDNINEKIKLTIQKYEEILDEEDMTFFEAKHPHKGLYDHDYRTKNFNIWFMTKKAMLNPDEFYHKITSYFKIQDEVDMLLSNRINVEVKKNVEPLQEVITQSKEENVQLALLLEEEKMKNRNLSSQLLASNTKIKSYRENFFIKVLRKLKIIKIY